MLTKCELCISKYLFQFYCYFHQSIYNTECHFFKSNNANNLIQSLLSSQVGGTDSPPIPVCHSSLDKKNLFRGFRNEKFKKSVWLTWVIHFWGKFKSQFQEFFLRWITGYIRSLVSDQHSCLFNECLVHLSKRFSDHTTMSISFKTSEWHTDGYGSTIVPAQATWWEPIHVPIGMNFIWLFAFN